jgi:hypothetical protein
MQMQTYDAAPETSNPAIERWKEMPRTPEHYQVIEDYLKVESKAQPAPRSFKKFLTDRLNERLAKFSKVGGSVKELLDLMLIFGEGTNETLAEALSIEKVMCASDPETRRPADPTMLEILGADINPDLFRYICTLPVGTTAQQFVDGCTNPAYLLIAMDATDLDWESTARVTHAIEKMSDADACKYLRSDTRYADVLVKSLNAMMK